jgi:hypothetical protein
VHVINIWKLKMYKVVWTFFSAYHSFVLHTSKTWKASRQTINLFYFELNNLRIYTINSNESCLNLVRKSNTCKTMWLGKVHTLEGNQWNFIYWFQKESFKACLSRIFFNIRCTLLYTAIIIYNETANIDGIRPNKMKQTTPPNHTKLLQRNMPFLLRL